MVNPCHKDRRVVKRSHLVDLLLGVRQQGGEVAQGVTVQDHLGLLVCSRHDVPHGPERRRLGEESEGGRSQ